MFHVKIHTHKMKSDLKYTYFIKRPSTQSAYFDEFKVINYNERSPSWPNSQIIIQDPSISYYTHIS